MIKHIIILMVPLILMSSTFPKLTTKWVITQSSSLTINGSTNVNKFSCAILSYPNPDTIFINQDKPNEQIRLTGVLSLDVKNFDCNNMMMTHQFRKTLKHEEFPVLHINFISLQEVPSTKMISLVKGLVSIKIAGKIKRFEICYQLERFEHKLILRGAQNINFSDFNLVPPNKVGKLIKAKDQLTVSFELKMNLIES